ncbi:MAG: efflux RND transporter periplasmic adaptor subunit [Butyrivibrio sp.]|nr:efflux RND transporter periplasmic adaptor subunit [Butyrivibrio sp.]
MFGLKRAFLTKITAAVSLAAVLFTACGKVSDSGGIPELAEPTATNYAYRPAEYGSIGNTSVIFGTVVPESHCYFYGENVRISEIAVEVGDEAAVGDVLAYADIAYAVEQMDSLSGSLDYENTTYELNRKIADEELRKLGIYRQEALDSGDTEGAKRLALSIATANENSRYDEMLHNARVENIMREIASQQDIINSGTLTADCNGRVAYIKNIAESRYAAADENVVIICDSDEAYIELDIKSNEYKYSAYEIKYLQIGGSRYEARELSYSPREMAVARMRESYPNVRIACPEGVALNIGDTYPVYFCEKDLSGVLIVGNDSLYSDDGGSFVYVKASEQGREKRYVETGSSDDNYTEVVSGISEGEQIFYESASVMPSNYTEYKAELADFEIGNFSQKYELADTLDLLQNSEYEGEILEICVERGQEVAEGDLLYIIDSGEGKAALTKAQFDMEREKEAYAADLERFEAELKRLGEEATSVTACDISILDCRKQLSIYSHERNLASLQKRYDTLHEGNDGSGKISVYSSLNGTVKNIGAREGDKVAAGDSILTIAVASKPKMYVKMESVERPVGSITPGGGYLDNIADFGETVYFNFAQESYEGECIGWTAGGVNSGKTYLFSDDEGVHLTRSSSYDGSAGFYVRLYDDNAYEMPLSATVNFLYVSMTDVMVLPVEAINKENDGKAFVWRIKDGQLVKQYVLIDENIANGQKQVILSGVNPGDMLAVPY